MIKRLPYYTFGLVFVAMFGALAMLLFFAGERVVEASPFGTALSSATTTSRVSITTSVQIMATSTNSLGDENSHSRAYASICNPGTNPVWLHLSKDVPTNIAAGKQTTAIAAAAGYNVCYEITDRNLYSGAITASSTNETATVIYTSQFVQ